MHRGDFVNSNSMKKWLLITKQFLINNSYLILFAATLLIMEVIMRFSLSQNLSNFYMIKRMAMTFSVGNILFLCIPLVLLPKRAKKYYAIFFIFLASILMIVNEVHFTVFKDFISCKQLVLLKEATEFGGAGFGHIRPAHYLLILIALVSSVLMFFLLRKYNKREKFYFPILILILAFIFYGYGQTQINRTNNADWTLFENEAYIHDNLNNTKTAMHLFGFYEYTKQDLFINVGRYFKPADKGTISEIDQYFTQNPRVHQSNAYSGLLKDKNVIFVLAESLDKIAYNQVLMPNLMMLHDQGLAFDNFYAPAYPRTTSDSEFISLTGLFPSIESGPTCYNFNRNDYRYSFANMLRNNGYTANSFHNNGAEVYNRNIFHPSMGLEKFYDAKDLKLNDVLTDTNLIEKGKDLITPTDYKFFSHVLTISGHGDYNINYAEAEKYKDQVIAEYGDTYPEETLGYIAYQMEFDAFLGEMIKDIEAKGLLNDTVIVVMADHYPYMMQESNYQAIKGTNQAYEYAKLPFIIYNPSLKPEVVDQLVTTVDVVPTLMNLLGIEYNANYYFGKDAFDANEENMVIYKDYSFYDGTTYYDADFKVTPENSALYQTLKGSLVKKVSIFQKILQSDYFRYKAR